MPLIRPWVWNGLSKKNKSFVAIQVFFLTHAHTSSSLTDAWPHANLPSTNPEQLRQRSFVSPWIAHLPSRYWDRMQG